MKRIPSAWLVIQQRTRSSEIPSEQKRKRENESGKKQTQLRPVNSPYALVLYKNLLLLLSILITFVRIFYSTTGSSFVNIRVFPMLKYFVSSNRIGDFNSLCSFGKVIPDYNIEPKGNSDSHYEISPGTKLFVRVETVCNDVIIVPSLRMLPGDTHCR
jgi:hypothetical protein